MIKYKKNCSVCKAVKENKRVLERIYNSSWYVPSSQDSLRKISRDHEDLFSYEALRNHVKKHQFLSQDDYTEKELNNISKAATGEILRRQASRDDVWNEIMSQGLEKLQSGEIKLNAGHLLKATKDKSDFEMKQKDHQLAMMEMIAHFASGENTESKHYDRRFVKAKASPDNHAAVGTSGDSSKGPDGPSDIHREAVGDETPPRANQVLTGNPSPQNP